MRFEQFEHEAAIAAAAADVLDETLRARPDACVVLAAGRSPARLYVELVERARAQRTDLSRARLFQLDEYVGVEAADAHSFQAQLRVQLLDPLRELGRDPARDFVLDGGAKDPRAEIERHAVRLARLGGADLVFLGIGANGHVAFNEPGATLGDRARVVTLARDTRLAAQAEFGRARGPTRGITLGLLEIDAARRIALLATGAGKAAILAALFDEPVAPQRPASLLLAHADFTILADAAAAAALHAVNDGDEGDERTGRPEKTRRTPPVRRPRSASARA